jgi:hypothetical protein
MRQNPIVEHVDVVIGPKGQERLISIAKPIADRWPDLYRPAETEKGNPTAAAQRATDLRDVDPAPITTPDELPSATDTAAATASADATAGTSGVTTEGVTS